MHRATENLVIRTAGAFAYTALLVHAAFAAPGFAYPGLVLAPFFAGTVAANWGLCRLNVKRRALQVTTFGVGGLSVVAFLLAVPERPWTSLEVAVHAAEGLLGLVTLAFGGYMLLTRS